MNDFIKHWENRIEDLSVATDYAKLQLGRVVIKGCEQLTLPIERLMDDNPDLWGKE